MSFDYHVRRKADPVSEGIARSLRGEPAADDPASPETWSLEKIRRAQEEQQRRDDELDAGRWPMPIKPY